MQHNIKQKTRTRLKFPSVFRAGSKSPGRAREPLSSAESHELEEHITTATLSIEENLEIHPSSSHQNSPQEDTLETEDPSQYGLFTLYEPPSGLHSDEQFPVDIIALHGINGKAFKTWTYVEESGPNKGKETFWLRDFLPEEFPGARVYTYGYNAKIFSMGTGTLESFARTLLELIMDKRRTRKDQRRPIIFICHSMGGLVVKKALAMANAHDSRQRNVRTSTFAIFFIATPHRGSEPAAWLATFATISNGGLVGTGISRFKGRTRNDLIRNLSFNSPILVEINTEFGPMMDGSIKFYSFIEDLTATGLNTRIVNNYSGQMNVEAEVVIDMGGEDHKSIARYKSKKSLSYKKVLAKLQEAVRDAIEPLDRTMKAEDLPCLQSLAFPTMTHRKQEVTNSHLGSCQWILTHPSFTTWTNSDKGLLWIKGHPGTGKSTLMAFIHRRLTASSRSIRLEFFFSGRGQPLQKSVLGMFRSLLCQLYEQSPFARERIYDAYKEKQRSFGSSNQEWSWQVDELRSLLTEVVKEASMKVETTFFIDALDEAVFESGEKAAMWLVKYFYEVNDAMLGLEQDGSVRGVRICISCRHYPVIGSLGPGLEIHVENHTKLDITRYVEHQLASTVEGWDEVDSRDTKTLVDAIVRKAFGVFLWAVLNVPRIVKRLNDGRVTIAQASRLVEDESSELFSLYTKILKHDISERVRKRSLLFLQWVCLAMRPLSLSELRFALACDSQDGKFFQDCCEMEAKDFVTSDAQMKKLAKSLSGGLAEVLEWDGTTRVQFIHETVNDYLRQGGLEILFPIAGLTLGPDVMAASQNRLTWCCVNYLRIDNVIDALNAWNKWDEPCPVFIKYVARWLFVHAAKGEMYQGIGEQLTPFLISSLELLENWRTAVDKMSTIAPLASREISPLYFDSSELIYIASTFNLLGAMRSLLSTTSLREQRDSKGNTALHLAALRGHGEMCKLLLQHEADPNAVNGRGVAPIELAAANRHDGIVKMFLHCGAKVNGSSIQSQGALQAAIEKLNLPLVKILLDAGADISAEQGKYGTPLQRAASLVINPEAIEAIVRLLLDYGADINARNSRHGNPLQLAIASDNLLVVNLLLERGADIHVRGGEFESVLQTAAMMGNWPLAIRLVHMGADIHAVGGAFGSALQAASMIEGNEEFVKLLLENGADVNVKLGEVGSALEAAAASGNESTVRILLSYEAEIHSTGGEYDDVMQAAVASGNKSLVKYLLSLNVEVNTQGGIFGSPLQAAIVKQHSTLPKRSPELIELLLARGADVNSKGPRYGSPLFAAVAFKAENVVKQLLAEGADVNMTVADHICTSFPNVLQKAASTGPLSLVKILLNAGAKINLEEKFDWQLWNTSGTALTVAAYHGKNEIVELLLDEGAALSPWKGYYSGALYAAAYRGHKEIVELLLEKGAGADPRDGAREIMLKVRGGERLAPSHY